MHGIVPYYMHAYLIAISFIQLCILSLVYYMHVAEFNNRLIVVFYIFIKRGYSLYSSQLLEN